MGVSISPWIVRFFGLTFVIVGAQNVTCSSKQCNKSGDPVCGSNSVTYPSQCHLEKAQCQDSNLTLAHEGPCQNQGDKPCLVALAYFQANPKNTYKPQCRPDGTFANVQCHPDTGYCWCVTARGNPVQNTSVRWKSGAKPRCKRKKKTRRRSSFHSSRKPRRNCKREDKALFNNNLIKIFHTEYSRTTSAILGPEADKLVLDWKFKYLDVDNNNILDKTEYRDLKKIVKKAVKPKRCAKSFAKACDMNRDQQIERQEWADCLTRDGIDDARGEDSSKNEKDDEDEDEDGDDFFAPPKKPSNKQNPNAVLRPPPSGQNYDEESQEIRDEDTSDCLSDRQTALNEHHNGLYVPECTPDGRYQKIQCYKSAGYCWCVHEDTGKNIPGTSVKNQTPKCDQIPVPSRPMKGCPDDKKLTFLRELMEFLQHKMLKDTNGTMIGSEIGWKATKEEQAATWNFVILDKNKNKVLDKHEWKAFKDMVSTVKNLKKCGKKLPRYCDINKDRQISMTEWLDCLNTQRRAEHVATTPSPGSLRTGTNPLHMLLDD
ncbi:SPARC-related modular calcium-binding protein 1 isoform X2 [Agrilus planipennis]|uniref:SPARC-related modular calcium-binding protein 1 isoform X2 n=1 Tax=Agrilus planipennis TaxID=224129 RepID=A0A7F5R8Z9_AGRPL|nr:SPARC-related modular calcium-binding protein 1 isoform X2 [Agrilus planipennis]